MFILRKEKNRNLAYISSKQVILCFGIKPITFLSTNWQKTPFCKMNFYIYFFRRCSCKYSCFSELANNSLYQTNDPQLEFQKRRYYLKTIALDFALLVFKLLPNPRCYLTSIMDKTHHGPVIALFSVQLQQLFLTTSNTSL